MSKYIVFQCCNREIPVYRRDPSLFGKDFVCYQCKEKRGLFSLLNFMEEE